MSRTQDIDKSITAEFSDPEFANERVKREEYTMTLVSRSVGGPLLLPLFPDEEEQYGPSSHPEKAQSFSFVERAFRQTFTPIKPEDFRQLVPGGIYYLRTDGARNEFGRRQDFIGHVSSTSKPEDGRITFYVKGVRPRYLAHDDPETPGNFYYQTEEYIHYNHYPEVLTLKLHKAVHKALPQNRGKLPLKIVCEETGKEVMLFLAGMDRNMTIDDLIIESNNNDNMNNYEPNGIHPGFWQRKRKSRKARKSRKSRKSRKTRSRR